MISETRDSKQTSLAKPGAHAEPGTMIQMNLIKYLIDRIWVIIFLFFKHIMKLPPAFVVNKFSFIIIWFKYTQNIYTLSQETIAHICLMYFDLKPVSENS